MNQTNFDTRSSPQRIKINKVFVQRKIKHYLAYYPVQYSVCLALACVLIGWLILGWLVWPVSWTGASPAQMAENNQALYLLAVAERFAFDNNVEKVQRDLAYWDGATYACQLVPRVNFESQLRLLAMVYTIGERCNEQQISTY